MRLNLFSASVGFLFLLLDNTLAFQPIRYDSLLHKNRVSLPPQWNVRHQNHPCTKTSLHSLGTLVDGFFRSSPYAAAAVTCGFKACTADWMVQRQQQKQRMDWKRNLAFVVYGALYQGVTQEFVYNHLYPRLLGRGTSVSIVLSKVLFDLLIQTTLVTLPVAYLTKAAVFKYSIRKAMGLYRRDIREQGLLKKYFLLWGPVQCLTFSVVPEHYRVSFIACVSFFWLLILSTITSNEVEKKVSVNALKKLGVGKEKEMEVAALGE